jgi:plastocyanin
MMKTVRERGTWRARIRLSLYLGTVVVVLGVIAATAWAVAQPIGSVDNSFTGGSGDPANPTFTMDQGDRPAFSDGGANQHNVTARQNGPDGKVLFSTPTLNGGQSATLDGTQYLPAGSYTFFCTIHPTEMQASLVVTGNGTPQARPHIDLRIVSRKLAKVKKKGKLLVQVTASTSVAGASVEARLGPNAILGRTGNLSLTQGAQTVIVKLTKRGKTELKSKKKARISVDGSVPFGPPASAKRKLS